MLDLVRNKCRRLAVHSLPAAASVAVDQCSPGSVGCNSVSRFAYVSGQLAVRTATSPLVMFREALDRQEGLLSLRRDPTIWRRRGWFPAGVRLILVKRPRQASKAPPLQSAPTTTTLVQIRAVRASQNTGASASQESFYISSCMVHGAHCGHLQTGILGRLGARAI